MRLRGERLGVRGAVGVLRGRDDSVVQALAIEAEAALVGGASAALVVGQVAIQGGLRGKHTRVLQVGEVVVGHEHPGVGGSAAGGVLIGLPGGHGVAVGRKRVGTALLAAGDVGAGTGVGVASREGGGWPPGGAFTGAGCPQARRAMASMPSRSGVERMEDLRCGPCRYDVPVLRVLKSRWVFVVLVLLAAVAWAIWGGDPTGRPSLDPYF